MKYIIMRLLHMCTSIDIILLKYSYTDINAHRASQREHRSTVVLLAVILMISVIAIGCKEPPVPFVEEVFTPNTETGFKYGCVVLPGKGAEFAIGAEGTAYVVSGDELYAVETTLWKDYRWRRRLGTGRKSALSIGEDGNIYLAVGSVVHVIQAETGEQKREIDVSGAVSGEISLSPLAVASGSIYLASGSMLYAVNASGDKQWDYTIPKATEIAFAPVAGTEGSIYLVSGSTLYAVSAASGAEQWDYTIPTDTGISAVPVVGADGSIYLVSGSTLYTIDKTTGTLKTELDITNMKEGQQALVPIVGADGALYIASGNTLYRLDSTSKAVVEKVSITNTQTETIVASKAIRNKAGEIYVGDEQGTVCGVDSKPSYKQYHAGWAIESSPALGNEGTIYVGSDGTYLHAIGKEGEQKWVYNTRGAVRSSPSVGDDGTIYVGSDDEKVYALRADGKLKWKYSTRGAVRSSPAIGNDGTIYVGSNDEKVHAIGRDGKQKWTYETGGMVQSSPAVGGVGEADRIYVGSDDGYLYALDEKGGVLWREYLGGKIRTTPAIGSGGEIYIVVSTGFVYGFHANSLRLWGAKVSDRVIRSSPVIAVDGAGKEMIIIGTAEGVHALRSVDGKELWTNSKVGAIESTAAVGGEGEIYVGSTDGHVYILDREGKEKEKVYIGSVGTSSMVLGTEQGVIGTRKGVVYRLLDVKSGYEEESAWPGRGRDKKHSGRGVTREGFVMYELQAPELASNPVGLDYNRIEVGLEYEPIMAGNSRAGAMLSINDIEFTLYYSTKAHVEAELLGVGLTTEDLYEHAEYIEYIVEASGETSGKSGKSQKRLLTVFTKNVIETPWILKENTAYYYMVRAKQLRDPNETRYSNIVEVKTPYEPTKPGIVRAVKADESEKKALEIRAIIPRHFGKDSSGTPLGQDAVKYWLYYARVGYTPAGSAEVSTSTDAGAVIQAVGTITGDSNKDVDVGRLEQAGDSSRDTLAFRLVGLTGGEGYRYTIVTVHKNDDTKRSRPSPAETAEVKSEATAPGKARIRAVDTATKQQLTFNAEEPSNTGIDADGVTAVDANDLRYRLYYARVGYEYKPFGVATAVKITTSTDADTVVEAVGNLTDDSNKDIGRIEQEGSTLARGFLLQGLRGGEQYRYTIVTLHPDYDKDTSLRSDPAVAATATVGSEASSGAVVGMDGVIATSTKDGFTITGITAPRAYRLGKKADGTHVTADEVRYKVYYARVGYAPAGKAVITTGTTAEQIKQVAESTPVSDRKDAGTQEIKGNDALTKTGFIVTGLTGGEQYRYTIVTVHPDDSTLTSSPTEARTATVKSEATAPGTVTGLTADASKERQLTFRATAPRDTGAKADGVTAVDADTLKYWLYYAKVGRTIHEVPVTDTTNANAVVRAVGSDASTSNSGKKEITGSDTLQRIGIVATGLTGGAKYRYTIVTVHPDDDTLTSSPAEARTATVKSEATTPGAVTSPTVTEQGDDIIVTATPPIDRGKKADGTDVGEEEITYTLYYVKEGGDDGVQIQDNASKLIKTKAEKTGVASTVAGKKALTGNTALASGFRIEGLTEDTLYQYFIRTTHPDDVTRYSDTSKALVFILKPKGGKAEVIQPTLADGTLRTEISDEEYKRSGGTHIRRINIPRTIKKIGSDAFKGNRLGRVDLPDSLEELGIGAFNDNRIEEITFGSKLKHIPKHAFHDNYLKSVDIPDTVESVGKNAFTANKNLKTVTLSETLYDKIRAQEGGLDGVFGDQVTRYQDHKGNLLLGNPLTVTNINVDTSRDRRLIFRATPTTATGRPEGSNTDVPASELKYVLFYAKIGYTEKYYPYAGGGTFYIIQRTRKITSKSSVQDIMAVGNWKRYTSETGFNALVMGDHGNKPKGKIEINGDTLKNKGFILDGLISGDKYRYTIVTIFPDKYTKLLKCRYNPDAHRYCDSLTYSATPAQTITVP